MLSAERLSLKLGQKQVLDGVSLTLEPGSVTGLGGPSGAGKTSLGRCLAGLIAPAEGAVRLNGSALPPLRAGRPHPVQYVPQMAELAVDPRWRIGDILRNGGEPDAEVLAALGIDPTWEKRHAGEVSGGELTRVSLARLILPSTRVLILDEVTARLDALSEDALWQALLPLARTRGLTLLIISHKQGLRQHLCSASYVLANGKLVQETVLPTSAMRRS
ncbi:ATP-binding cassette domain-containing protein [Pannonibacter phragmitetus]|uniref:ATP-binding cassette domain-containing protein n=1 Tax=Pannonibacter phragmitetus TaxID=121719 RepID=UPI000F4596D9|nr:ATP-binding cassette domain-containing protein [Pannonibacter phragmitetus]MBA4207775.1 ABC transporter ATP-binding protein [Polymorphum sp.]